MKNLKSIISYILGAVLVLGGVALAGSLAPTEDTSTPTMYTLTDIYNKLTAGTSATEGDHDISTTSSPLASMNTLEEIYDSIPAYITLDGSTTTLPFGIYATTTLDSIDTDLISDNIIEGKTIFGVEGGAEVGGGALEWSANDPAEDVTWNDAVLYCTSLGGGYRLPYLEELVQESPIGSPTFTNVGVFQSGRYWSGVSHPMFEEKAYDVDMGYGFVDNSDKTDFIHFARCVR